MLKANFITAQEAAEKIQDGSILCTIGMTLVSASESILKAIEKRFETVGHPADITLVHSCGQSDRKDGIQHLAHEGLVKRIVGSHWGLQPRWMEMIANSQVEAYCLPQGQIAQLYRSMACGLPGKMSKVGLGTFIDPRVEGGKMNDRTKPLPDLVDILEYGGEEYMFYKEIPLDTVLIRGTVCDEMGNLTTTEEAMKLEVLPAVLAAKRYGGRVIAQVKQVVQSGTINPKDVTVPGVFIDDIVVCENPMEDHRQTSSWYYDPSYCGLARVPAGDIPPAPFNERKFIARRGAQELYRGAVINLGTGIPNDMIGKVCNEEKVSDDVVITVESGIYGGVQAGYLEKGCSWITLFIAMAPSLGFLGTVIGMVQAFDKIQQVGDISPTVVAGGMKVALITTIFGLIVALILQVFYNYVLSKIEALTSEMEDSSISLLDMVIKYNLKYKK